MSRNASETWRPGSPPPFIGAASDSASRTSSSVSRTRAERRRSIRSSTHGSAALACSTV
jgi:hypothetical protein